MRIEGELDRQGPCPPEASVLTGLRDVMNTEVGSGGVQR